MTIPIKQLGLFCPKILHYHQNSYTNSKEWMSSSPLHRLFLSFYRPTNSTTSSAVFADWTEEPLLIHVTRMTVKPVTCWVITLVIWFLLSAWSSTSVRSSRDSHYNSFNKIFKDISPIFGSQIWHMESPGITILRFELFLWIMLSLELSFSLSGYCW